MSAVDPSERAEARRMFIGGLRASDSEEAVKSTLGELCGAGPDAITEVIFLYKISFV